MGLYFVCLILSATLTWGQEENNACYDEERNRKCDTIRNPQQGCWFEDSPFMNPDTGEDCCPWEVCGRDCYDGVTDQTVSSGTRFVTTNEDGTSRDCRCVPNQNTGDSYLDCNTSFMDARR